jgi:hypothetical protein
MSLSAESKQFLRYVASQPKGRVGYPMGKYAEAATLAGECLERGLVKERRFFDGLGFQITDAGKAYLAGEVG